MAFRLFCLGVIFLIACGCTSSKTSDVVPLLFGFSCEFSISNSDLSGELTVEDNGVIHMEFITPKIINGTRISVNDSHVVIEVQDISKRYDRESVPEDSPALHIFDALTASVGKTIVYSNGEYYINGNSASGEYRLYFNSNGNINKIYLNESDTEIILS